MLAYEPRPRIGWGEEKREKKRGATTIALRCSAALIARSLPSPRHSAGQRLGNAWTVLAKRCMVSVCAQCGPFQDRGAAWQSEPGEHGSGAISAFARLGSSPCFLWFRSDRRCWCCSVVAPAPLVASEATQRRGKRAMGRVCSLLAALSCLSLTTLSSALLSPDYPPPPSSSVP